MPVTAPEIDKVGGRQDSRILTCQTFKRLFKLSSLRPRGQFHHEPCYIIRWTSRFDSILILSGSEWRSSALRSVLSLVYQHHPPTTILTSLVLYCLSHEVESVVAGKGKFLLVPWLNSAQNSLFGLNRISIRTRKQIKKFRKNYAICENLLGK